MYRILSLLNTIRPAREVFAHCDIPCGIYDPHVMQLAAHTVLRMAQLIGEASPDDVHGIARYTQVKEEHGELCKREIRVLWGDYFKPEHVEQYPELPELIWKGLKAGSKARQEKDVEAAKELVRICQHIAEVFWKTKGVEPVRGKSFYPTEGELVYPKV